MATRTARQRNRAIALLGLVAIFLIAATYFRDVIPLILVGISNLYIEFGHAKGS